MKKRIFAALLAFIMTMAALGGREAYASNISDSTVAMEVTNRMLLGLPTTLEEQLGVSAPNLTIPVTPSDTGYIIIGDSRMTSLNVVCNVNSTPDNWFVVACAGVHLNYLPEVAIPAAQRVEAAHPEIGHWKYIINLGLTDLNMAKSYADYLSQLALSKDVYFMSINPTSPTQVTKTYSFTNERIAAFNSAVSKAPNVKYIDTFSQLAASGYKTADDGFHYDSPTTRLIYQAVKLGAV